MTERVVITGMGAITPLGHTLPETWDNIVEGRSGITRITSFDATDFGSQIAGEVKEFKPEEKLSFKEAKRLDRFCQLALVAAKEALDDSGLVIDEANSEEIGVIMGSGVGGMITFAEQLEVLRTKGPRRVSPFLIPMYLANVAAGQIAIATGARGPNYATVSACATSAHAIGEATQTIMRGDAKAIIAGGSEAGLLPIGVAGFAAMKALSTRNDAPQRASRPFDRERDGFVMAEGGGALILEAESFAKARGARIYGEVAGYGATDDAFHITSPPEGGEGAVRAMNMAMRKAEIGPSDVDYVNAHGTSTPVNDRLETAALKTVFREGVRSLPISSTKSMTGHLLGAAGAVEAIFCVKAILDGTIPPTINYEFPDPECDLDYVANEARQAPVETALTNSFGFGGHNVSLVIRRYR
jgi:3-oxoacyl-[acyl-carrier-protein] synthase II